MKNAYVLEWSKKQNSFHIQKLEYAMAKNQHAFIDDSQLNDYHIIMVGEFDAVTLMADSW